MRISRSALAAVTCVIKCLPAAHAQTSFISPDGHNRFPGVTVFCPNGTGVVPCNFSGNGGGAVSINLGGAAVSAGNRLPVSDPALDALISFGTLSVGGTVALSGAPSVAVASLPALPAGSNAIGSVSITGTPSISLSGTPSVAVGSLPALSAGTNTIGNVGITGTPAVAISGTPSVAVSSLPALPPGSNTIGTVGITGTPAVSVTGTPSVAVSNFPGTQTVSGALTVTALPALPAGGNTIGTVGLASGSVGSVTAGGTAGTVAQAVQGIAGGVAMPVSGTFWPSTQPISAASLPLPTGAATNVSLTAPLGPVAPGTATATASTVVGCQAATSLPSFTAGQQGAVPCDTSGRLYVVTVPSANNVPGYLQAVSAGGASTFAAVNAASSCMATNVKSTSGMVFGYSISNSNSSGIWARLFASSTAPSCGSGTPVERIYVPAGATVALSTDLGWVFANGIGFDVTSGSGADTDSTTVAAANSVLVNIDYK